jgi:hypothetical protein
MITVQTINFPTRLTYELYLNLNPKDYLVTDVKVETFADVYELANDDDIFILYSPSCSDDDLGILQTIRCDSMMVMLVTDSESVPQEVRDIGVFGAYRSSEIDKCIDHLSRLYSLEV